MRQRRPPIEWNPKTDASRRNITCQLRSDKVETFRTYVRKPHMRCNPKPVLASKFQPKGSLFQTRLGTFGALSLNLAKAKTRRYFFHMPLVLFLLEIIQRQTKG